MAKLSANQQSAVDILAETLKTSGADVMDLTAWKRAVNGKAKITVASLVGAEAVEEIKAQVAGRTISLFRPR